MKAEPSSPRNRNAKKKNIANALQGNRAAAAGSNTMPVKSSPGSAPSASQLNSPPSSAPPPPPISATDTSDTFASEAFDKYKRMKKVRFLLHARVNEAATIFFTNTSFSVDTPLAISFLLARICACAFVCLSRTKFKLPEQAVRHEMEKDGIAVALINKFCPSTFSPTALAKPPPVGQDMPLDQIEGPHSEASEGEETRATNEGEKDREGGHQSSASLDQENDGDSNRKYQAAFLGSIKKGKELRRISVIPGSRVEAGPRNFILDGIKKGANLRKAEPLPPKPPSARDQILTSIRRATLKSNLNHVEPMKHNENDRTDDAVAKLLANRTAIAGGDSDTDSDFDDYEFDSDEDYP